MANFKYVLACVVSVLLIGVVLNLFIAPFVDTSEPAENSTLEGFATFVDEGINVSLIELPLIGEIGFNFDPTEYIMLGITEANDFVIQQVNLLTYLPDMFVLAFVVVIILVFGYLIIAILRGI